MRAIVTGPRGTPYEGGLFEFHIFLPSEVRCRRFKSLFDDRRGSCQYPNTPPLVSLETTGNGTVRFNPNLYANGKVLEFVLFFWRFINVFSSGLFVVARHVAWRRRSEQMGAALDHRASVALDPSDDSRRCAFFIFAPRSVKTSFSRRSRTSTSRATRRSAAPRSDVRSRQVVARHIGVRLTSTINTALGRGECGAAITHVATRHRRAAAQVARCRARACLRRVRSPLVQVRRRVVASCLRRTGACARVLCVAWCCLCFVLDVCFRLFDSRRFFFQRRHVGLPWRRATLDWRSSAPAPSSTTSCCDWSATTTKPKNNLENKTK